MKEKIDRLIEAQEKTNLLLKEQLIQTVVKKWRKREDLDGYLMYILGLELIQSSSIESKKVIRSKSIKVRKSTLTIFDPSKERDIHEISTEEKLPPQ